MKKKVITSSGMEFVFDMKEFTMSKQNITSEYSYNASAIVFTRIITKSTSYDAVGRAVGTTLGVVTEKTAEVFTFPIANIALIKEYYN